MRPRTALSCPRSIRRVRWTTLCLATTACLAGSESAPSARLPSGLLVVPPWAALEPGAKSTLVAALVGAGGDTVHLAPAVWSSTRSHVATVDSAGRVTAVAPGVDTIVALFGQLGGYAVIIVGPPILVGAGDIASCSLSSDDATAAALDTTPGVVFTAGDNAYQDGTTDEFVGCYAPNWGRHRVRTRPTPGNHEYHTPGALPYFTYFGVNAGELGKGYYSYDVGTWHAIALNSSIASDAGSPQEQWLRADLAAHPVQCTVAYWHFPRFSSGAHGNIATVGALWQALYDGGADVVVSGHDHIYERFAPQAPDGTADPARGIREFVVGTGGGQLTTVATIRPNSEARIAGEFGVLRLTLLSSGYDWRFIPVSGATTTDSGRATCH